MDNTTMVMTGQTDFLELLFSNSDNLTLGGEVNFFVPPVDRERDFEQQLDMSDLIATDSDLSIIPTTLLDECCGQGVAETVEIAQEADLSTSIPEQQLVFQFPPHTDLADDLASIATEASLLSDVTDFDSSYASTPFSPTTPQSCLPATPSTASSVDSTSSHIPSFLKQGLKMRIQSKRRQQGKEEIKVEFRAPEPEQLTEEEEARRIEKREKNKLAAQKCRGKKKATCDKLEDEIKQLNKTNQKQKLDIQQLLDEREHLMDILKIHSSVCPKLRIQSAAF